MDQVTSQKQKNTAGLVTRGAILRTSFLMAQIISALWLMPLLIHSLGDHLYGIWAVLASIMGLLSIADLGMSPTSQRFLAMSLGREEREEFNAILSSGLAFFVGVAIVVLIFIAGRIIWTEDLSVDPGDVSATNVALGVMGLQSAIGFLFRPVTTALTAALRYDLTALMEFVALILRVGLSTAFVLNGYGIIALALIGLGSQAVMQVGLAIWFGRTFPWARFSPHLVSMSKIKTLLYFGFWVFFVNLTRTASLRMPPLLIAAILGPAQVVFYAIASRLVEYMNLFVHSFVSVLYPLMSSKHGEEDAESLVYYYFTSSRICAFVTTIMATSVYIFGEAFITLWIGADHRDAVYPLYILLCGFYFIMLYLPSQFYLMAIAKHRAIAIAALCEILVALGLSLALAKDWGVNGICVAMVVPMIANKAGFEVYYICRQLKVSIFKFIANIAKVILPIVAIQGAYFAALQWIAIDSAVIYLFVGGAVSTLGWGVAFMVALPQSDRKLLLRAVSAALPRPQE